MSGDPEQLRTDLDQIARRVRAARAYAGLTINQLAERLAVGAYTVRQIEAGKRGVRRYELWGIAEVCGLSLDFFEDRFEATDTS